MSNEHIEAIFAFAISEEEQAAGFYRRLAERVEQPALKQALLEFAAEEDYHKSRLLEMQRSGVVTSPPEGVMRDLGIADGLKAKIPIPEELDYRQALELAMSKEKAAFRFYTSMAESVKDERCPKYLSVPRTGGSKTQTEV